MTDSSDSPFSSRGTRTSPDAVAERTFSQAKRGYAESEVRAYLRRVADDVGAGPWVIAVTRRDQETGFRC